MPEVLQGFLRGVLPRGGSCQITKQSTAKNLPCRSPNASFYQPPSTTLTSSLFIRCCPQHRQLGPNRMPDICHGTPLPPCMSSNIERSLVTDDRPESQFRVKPSAQTSADYGRPHELKDSSNVEYLSSMETFSDEPSQSLSKKGSKRNRRPPPGGFRCPFSIPREGYLSCPKPSAQTRRTVSTLYDLP